MNNVKLEDIVSLSKRRGFIFPGSDVYGGLSGTWDYGPLGVTLKKNIMNLWWKMFVEDRDDMLGVDAAILMNQKVWQASGHVDTFTDPLVECGTGGCNMRYRADHLIKDYKGDEKLEDYQLLVNKIKADLLGLAQGESNSAKMLFLLKEYYENDTQRLKIRTFSENYPELNSERGASSVEIYIHNHLGIIYQESLSRAGKFDDELLLGAQFDMLKNIATWADLATQLFLNKNVKCQKCGSQYWSLPRQFNMMFKTNVGPMQDDNSVAYLRPETAQGIFTNFKNVVDTFYPDVPFGIAQQGKAFRNEISPRDFVFRSREFEQMEIEYFVHPDKWEEAFEEWVKLGHEWCDALGLPKGNVHELEVPEADRAHYSKRTIDFEFDFPIGREELFGLAYRTDFDLKNIERVSGKSMEYRPKDGSAPFVPHVIEPSFGVERALMAVLTAAYTVDEVNGEKREFLKLPYEIAPVKVAVLPLAKNRPELVQKAREIYQMLKKELGAVMWVDTGNIGKNYRKMDEIGVPYCVTVDFDTLEGDTKDTVTVRHRDTTTQERLGINKVVNALR